MQSIKLDVQVEWKFINDKFLSKKVGKMPEIEPKDKSLKELSGIHLWHAPMSSCSQRVRLVLSETQKTFISHLVNLEKDEHSSASYQNIHPNGLVPALVNDGRLFIESVDIIQYLSRENVNFFDESYKDLLRDADASQMDLKLLTFEFLFRGAPPPSKEVFEKFQKSHNNDWLKKFRIDFSKGFERQRIKDAVIRTAKAFNKLEMCLSDGRMYLSGNNFSLSDIAWIPNFHRFNLMKWSFEETPNLKRWFASVSQRLSYNEAILEWQPKELIGMLDEYTMNRISSGTNITSFQRDI